MLLFLKILPFIVTALIIVLGYYTNDKKRKNKHFKDDESQIEYYKSIYIPIKFDRRLPTIKKNGYKLEDIAENATIFCYDNPIPSKDEISKLKAGDLVKLNFVDKNHEVERMWVRYEKYDTGLHLGILDNDPFDINKLEIGAEVWFHSNNILIIDDKE